MTTNADRAPLFPVISPMIRQPLTKRAFVKAVALAASCIALTDARALADSATTLRIGYLRTQGNIADFPLAKVSLPNVQLQLIPLETGNDVLEAFNAGDIDIGETGEVQPIFAQSGGQPGKVIAVSGPQPKAVAILVRNSSPIRSVTDLRGKRVSLVEGTNTHWLVIQALGKVGLRQSDIVPVLLDPADTLSALTHGQIDAATLTAPNIQIAEAHDSRILIDGTGLVNSSIYYMARTSTITGSKRDTLARFVVALAAHLEWIHGHLQERADYLALLYGIPPNIVRAASEALSDHLVPVGDGKLAAYTQRIADAFAAQNLIPAHIDAREEFDGSFDEDLPG